MIISRMQYRNIFFLHINTNFPCKAVSQSQQMSFTYRSLRWFHCKAQREGGQVLKNYIIMQETLNYDDL